jgi:hypothetical protein
MTSDLCVIDESAFFIFANIELPIIDSPDRFVWSVWVSLSMQNFLRARELWHQPGREMEPPYFGWLNSSVPTYPETLNLKTNVHTRPVGARPFIELERTEHPLAREQRDGITWARVQEINAAIEHAHI